MFQSCSRIKLGLLTISSAFLLCWSQFSSSLSFLANCDSILLLLADFYRERHVNNYIYR